MTGTFRDCLWSSGPLDFFMVPRAIGPCSILAALRCHCNSAANVCHTTVQLRQFKHISYCLGIVQAFAVMTFNVMHRTHLLSVAKKMFLTFALHCVILQQGALAQGLSPRIVGT